MVRKMYAEGNAVLFISCSTNPAGSTWVYKYTSNSTINSSKISFCVYLLHLFMPEVVIMNKSSNYAADIQSSLNISNTDGSFTMAYSNSFLSPYEILPIAQEK